MNQKSIVREKKVKKLIVEALQETGMATPNARKYSEGVMDSMLMKVLAEDELLISELSALSRGFAEVAKTIILKKLDDAE